jgi:hypothetical protein
MSKVSTRLRENDILVKQVLSEDVVRFFFYDDSFRVGFLQSNDLVRVDYIDSARIDDLASSVEYSVVELS